MIELSNGRVWRSRILVHTGSDSSWGHQDPSGATTLRRPRIRDRTPAVQTCGAAGLGVRLQQASPKLSGLRRQVYRRQ